MISTLVKNCLILALCVVLPSPKPLVSMRVCRPPSPSSPGGVKSVQTSLSAVFGGGYYFPAFSAFSFPQAAVPCVPSSPALLASNRCAFHPPSHFYQGKSLLKFRLPNLVAGRNQAADKPRGTGNVKEGKYVIFAWDAATSTNRS